MGARVLRGKHNLVESTFEAAVSVNDKANASKPAHQKLVKQKRAAASVEGVRVKRGKNILVESTLEAVGTGNGKANTSGSAEGKRVRQIPATALVDESKVRTVERVTRASKKDSETNNVNGDEVDRLEREANKKKPVVVGREAVISR